MTSEAKLTNYMTSMTSEANIYQLHGLYELGGHCEEITWFTNKSKLQAKFQFS